MPTTHLLVEWLELLTHEIPLEVLLLPVYSSECCRVKEAHVVEPAWVSLDLVTNFELVWVLEVVELLCEDVLAPLLDIDGEQGVRLRVCSRVRVFV